MWNFLEMWENIWKLDMVFERGLKTMKNWRSSSFQRMDRSFLSDVILGDLQQFKKRVRNRDPNRSQS